MARHPITAARQPVPRPGRRCAAADGGRRPGPRRKAGPVLVRPHRTRACRSASSRAEATSCSSLGPRRAASGSPLHEGGEARKARRSACTTAGARCAPTRTVGTLEGLPRDRARNCRGGAPARPAALFGRAGVAGFCQAGKPPVARWLSAAWCCGASGPVCVGRWPAGPKGLAAGVRVGLRRAVRRVWGCGGGLWGPGSVGQVVVEGVESGQAGVEGGDGGAAVFADAVFDGGEPVLDVLPALLGRGRGAGVRCVVGRCHGAGCPCAG